MAEVAEVGQGISAEELALATRNRGMPLEALRYVGNVEPKEALAGQTDVVVSDGFTGNVFIKTLEATAKMLTGLIRDEIKANPINAVGGLLAKPAFGRVARRVDPFEVGGGPLLGVNGVVIVGHGRSNARAIQNAVGSDDDSDPITP